MTPELETYFNNYNELFNSEGFKQLLQELSTNATQLADIQTVKDVEDLYFRRTVSYTHLTLPTIYSV